jgi:hypothetical protein
MPPASRGSTCRRIRTPAATFSFFAYPYKADLKSLVWYVPENFEDAGYEVPETMEELKALTEQIVADGGTPWCIGIGSGGRHRLAGDRLGRGHHAAHPAARGLRPVGDQRDPVRTTSASSRPSRVRLVRQATMRSSTAALPRSRRPTSATARAASSSRRRAATCTARPRSSRPSSPRARTRRRRQLLLLPVLCRQGSRQSGARRRHAVRHHQGYAGRPRLHRVPEDADRVEIWMASGLLHAIQAA